MSETNLDIPYLMLAMVVLMALVILALIVATVSVKTLRAAKNRRYEARRLSMEPLLERFLVEREAPGLWRISSRDRDRYLAPLMVERMELLRGSDRRRIEDLARDLGLVEQYLRELGSRNRWSRARAAERLGYFGSPEETPAVAALLEDEDETVRAVAARALARIGSETAVEALTRTLDNPSELTRLRVAENLDRLGAAAVPPLVKLLEESVDPEGYGHSHGPVFACRVLGGLRARDARPVLRPAAREGEGADLRAQATLALGRIGDTEDVGLLLEAVGDEEWPVRVQSANALGMIGDPDTIPALERLVSDREWWVRYASAGALANMGRAGEESLVGLLLSEDLYARDRAAATLERRGLTRRFVRQLPLDNARGERARAAVSALVESGITRHLWYLLRQMPEGAERDALRDLLQVERAPEPEGAPRAGDSDGKGW